jgi:hypothetical protein
MRELTVRPHHEQSAGSRSVYVGKYRFDARIPAFSIADSGARKPAPSSPSNQLATIAIKETAHEDSARYKRKSTLPLGEIALAIRHSPRCPPSSAS